MIVRDSCLVDHRLLIANWLAPKVEPSLRAQRSNPEPEKDWIASSLRIPQ
jgi:hypothetical protein